MRSRQQIAGGLALMAIFASVIATMLAQREGSPFVAGRFAHPRFGWSIDVPAGFLASPIRPDSIVGETGVLISNFEVDEPWSLAEFRDFPRDGAALRFWSLEGMIGTPLPDDDSKLPLDLSGLEEIRPYVGKSEPRPLFGSVHGAGHQYAVAAWYGPEASDDDRAAIESALRSVEFPPTQPDTVVDRRLIVLGPSGEYPVGSVTRFDRGDLPLDGVFADYDDVFAFYLVRAPGGFYAITTDFLGNGDKCDLEVARRPLSFACPAEGWRWNRFGGVIEAGTPFPDGTEELVILPTPLSWDGNLMLDPFGNAPDEAGRAWGLGR